MVRLPLVASAHALKPFLNTGLVALVLIVVRRGAVLNQLPDHQPVTDSPSLKLFMYFIDTYKSLRGASPDNELVWLLKNTSLVVKNVTKMTF